MPRVTTGHAPRGRAIPKQFANPASAPRRRIGALTSGYYEHREIKDNRND